MAVMLTTLLVIALMTQFGLLLAERGRAGVPGRPLETLRQTVAQIGLIELSGLGAGNGAGLAIGEGSSYRLTQIFQKAARRLGVATTTRGRGTHFGADDVSIFGGRDALSLYVSWNGANLTAHTPGDTWETIAPKKLKQAGEAVLLTLSVLSREVTY